MCLWSRRGSSRAPRDCRGRQRLCWAGDFWGSHQGCQVPFCTSGWNVGLLLIRCSGQGNSRGQRGSLPQTRRGLTLLSQLCRDPAVGVRPGFHKLCASYSSEHTHSCMPGSLSVGGWGAATVLKLKLTRSYHDLPPELPSESYKVGNSQFC